MDTKKLSKFVSLLLRHQPGAFGLTLDAAGFTDVEAVWVQVMQKYGARYDRATFDTLLAESTRFEVVHNQVRALYGHSNVREIAYPPVTPPEILYHGTVAAALSAIKHEGLTSQARQYVHLSTDTSRADEVAGRRGAPILLIIYALAAHHAGHVFHHPEAKHYLVKAVAPAFIVFPDDV